VGWPARQRLPDCESCLVTEGASGPLTLMRRLCLASSR
jgi:hypothetical protein